MDAYKKLKVSDLRDIAKSRRLRGWSRLRKDDLISFIIGNENYPSDRATEDARRMGERTVKELRALARVRGVKIRSGANKSEIIYLLGENYGERRRAAYERNVGLWESEIRADEETARWGQEIDVEERRRRADEETARWNQEIDAEERRRRPSETVRPRLDRKAMNGTVQRWFVDGSEYLDPHVFLYDIADEVKRLVDSFNWPKNVHMNLSCVLEKEDPRTGVKEEDMFGSRSGTYTVTVQLGDMYDEMKDKMLENLAKFQSNGSGWRLKSIVGLEIGIVKFDPLSGSGYSKLPPIVANKKAVINMMNKRCKKSERISEETDDETKQCKCEKCKEFEMYFKWAVTRALNPVEDNPQRITDELRRQTEKYDWGGITFPTKVKDIFVWERNNNINVNVFGHDDDAKKTYTIRIAELKDPISTINLFLHDDNHYCVVKDLGRLVSDQLSGNDHGKDICLRCLNAFGRLTRKEKEAGEKKSLLEIHEEICSAQKLQYSVYPKPGETIKFESFERLHDIPFFVCADFESFVKPVQYAEQDPNKSFTNKYQSHVPSGFGYTINCMDENIYPTKTVHQTASYEGEDMGKAFVDSLTEDLRPIYEILKNPVSMVMTESDEVKHELAKECYACKDIFGRMCGINEDTGEPIIVKKCRDHCGAACNKCNLRMRVPMFVAVLFHNLEGYDSHLFVKSLG